HYHHLALVDDADGMISSKVVAIDASVASVPEGEQPHELMALERSDKMAREDAADGMMTVKNSGNTAGEGTVYDSAAEPELAADNTAVEMMARRTAAEVMADSTDEVAMANNNAAVAVMADNIDDPRSENHGTGDLGPGDTEWVALADGTGISALAAVGASVR
ncbi:hypothetical protein PIB30_071609, partial [Stylosanthes scabra]|nr:hypothetical protein [Stylosanthes scabra]